MFFHIIHVHHVFACIHETHWMHWHALGVPVEEEDPSSGGHTQEQVVMTGQEVQSPGAEGGEEVVVECPRHEPAVFVKGKPLSIPKSRYFQYYLNELYV
jgi:hypothetical protein